jgi:hypothetical protein
MNSVTVLDAITDTRCAVCGTQWPFEDQYDYADFEDLYWGYTMGCCDDPLPEFLIITPDPLLGDPAVDCDYEIPGQGVYEYPVDEDLISRLGDVE